MFQKVKGFQDIFGDDCIYWERAEAATREVFDLFGVNEIRLPMLERTAVFNRGIGQTTDIVEKEMFTFVDRDDDSLSLRPEGTAGTVRAYIENGMFNTPALKKLYYLGAMFRRENPQKGRFRQFTQSGVEFIGSSAPFVDADVINIMVQIFKRVGIFELTKVEINSVGCPKCRPPYHAKLIEYLSDKDDKLCTDCKRRLEKNPLRILDCKQEGCRSIIKDAPVMKDHLCDECAEHFSQVQQYLGMLNIEYKINPMMVRGLDYYVRTAFELVTDRLGAASAIGAGGRYDGLVELLGGGAIPGVGFAIGMDRVVALMKMVCELKPKTPKVFIVTFGGKTLEAGIALLNQLRERGIASEIDYEVKGMKNQMKQAGRSGANYAIIFGEDELARGAVTVRDLRNSEQSEMSIEHVIADLI
ncbi:MAG: histidine--tRNA ligase, partial [Deferribacteraceae bacterium]|nr:histidine--tRNA ligase [Deferribacteraceae bacterium]